MRCEVREEAHPPNHTPPHQHIHQQHSHTPHHNPPLHHTLSHPTYPRVVEASLAHALDDGREAVQNRRVRAEAPLLPGEQLLGQLLHASVLLGGAVAVAVAFAAAREGGGRRSGVVVVPLVLPENTGDDEVWVW